ncbi:MAG: ribosome-recycling factor [Chitinophagales bacterium]|nr:MAG: ribosome-recycling factor [Chitinophagales bacterium]
MTDEVKLLLEEEKEKMEKALLHLEDELSKIRAGRANPSMLSDIRVDYYGTMTPLQQISNVSVADARTLVIKPWDKSMLAPIEKAILASNIGLTPANDGEVIRLNIPPLTEERRKALVKQVHHLAEQSKVSMRNARRSANEAIKNMQKNGLAEDQVKKAEQEIQHITDAYIAKVDKHVEAKEKEIMTV